jgi:hypothetical protein
VIRLGQVTCLPCCLVLKRVETQLSNLDEAGVPILQTYNAHFLRDHQHISSSLQPRHFAEYCFLARPLTVLPSANTKCMNRFGLPRHQKLAAKPVSRVVRSLGAPPFEAEALQSEGGLWLHGVQSVSDEVHLEILGGTDCICTITGSRPWRYYLQSFAFKLSCPIFMV